MTNVAIFDANSLFSRAFWASQSDKNFERETSLEIGLSFTLSILDPDSQKIGRVFDKVLFCWDTAQKKDKQRTPKPPEYDGELSRFRKVLFDLIGGAHSAVPGCEADDQVATAAYREPTSNRVVVISGDKDLHQLCSGNIGYFCLNKKEMLLSEDIVLRWGVKRASQVAIALAIIGDKGDNVTGVKGWGPKRVVALFERVETGMNFEQALKVIGDQIPSEKIPEFLESLDLTLLDGGIEGVPEPLPLRFAAPSIVRSYGVKKIVGQISRIRAQYSGDSEEYDRQ